MENPFSKNKPTLTIAVAVAAVTAGALAYLYLTENGATARSSIKHKLKDEAKNLAAAFISSKTGIHKHTLKKVADHLIK